MPGQFRTRLRRALTGAEGGGPLARIKNHKGTKTPDSDDDYYKPGEKMPPLKYRRAVDPEHKAHLEAFSFKTAWRRRSNQSLYSPMGSRLPSRRSSFRRRSRSRSMAQSRRSSISNSSDYDAEEWVDSGIGASIAGDERPANIKEASDDEGDVLNVGLSRNPTEDPRDAKRKQSTGHRRSSSTKITSRPGTGSDHTRRASQPFTAEDLEIALQKSHLEATKEESDKSSAGTPYDEFDDPSPFLRPRGGSIYVPYDGQGTPPKMPFYWGNLNEFDDHQAPIYSRQASIFISNEGSFTPRYERSQSVFVPRSRRHSVLDFENEQDPPRSTAIFLANDSTETTRNVSVIPAGKPCECPPDSTAETAQQQSNHRPQPCCPSDAIAAILARTDIH